MTSLNEALSDIGNSDMRHIVSLSGGKDSTALAIYLRQNYPEIPAEYVFCDTGCELPETYEYLERLEALLGAEVNFVTALDLLDIAKKPGRNPFDIYLNEVYGGFLPSPQARWCTRVLKIEPFEKFVGDTHAYSYIGIRHDEKRDGYVAKKPPVLSQRPNIVPIYPFKDDKLGLAEVKRILDESGLGIPSYYDWRSRSGCYFCFYQQIGEWQGLREQHPELFELSKKYEKEKNGKRYTWTQARSLKELEKLPKRETIPLPDDPEGCAICHL